MTFVELIVAMTIMALVVGTLEVLAEAVHSAYGYNEAHGVATQHARVVLDRICRVADQCAIQARSFRASSCFRRRSVEQAAPIRSLSGIQRARR